VAVIVEGTGAIVSSGSPNVVGHVTTAMWAVRDVSGVGAARLAIGPDAPGETLGVAAGVALADEGEASGAEAPAGAEAPDAVATTDGVDVGVGPELPHAPTTRTTARKRPGTNRWNRQGRRLWSAFSGDPRTGTSMSAMVRPLRSAGHVDLRRSRSRPAQPSPENGPRFRSVDTVARMAMPCHDGP
jgi:hypothetical protein